MHADITKEHQCGLTIEMLNARALFDLVTVCEIATIRNHKYPRHLAWPDTHPDKPKHSPADVPPPPTVPVPLQAVPNKLVAPSARSSLVHRTRLPKATFLLDLVQQVSRTRFLRSLFWFIASRSGLTEQTRAPIRQRPVLLTFRHWSVAERSTD